ncbi:hypothetical protein DNL40_10245 [Xylanimonas oleitrophica]|uniref:Secreted protein n=1 Tax=Xylanimonas oleitrophica TaxID=2607479 RepID=A0A2W5WN32_9MICO|nr:hypothetical protein [Xylanimonas oleitrophica]PZR52747.1 hypothetical protein DNL40_10245 [Xylanimonas oleitrophica]
MRRLFWVGVGVAVTVVVYRRGRKVVQQYMPASVAERAEQAAQDLGERADSFVQEFRVQFTQARARREAELTAALLADGQPDPEQTRAARATGARGGLGQPSRAAGGPVDDDEAELGYSF